MNVVVIYMGGPLDGVEALNWVPPDHLRPCFVWRSPSGILHCYRPNAPIEDTLVRVWYCGSYDPEKEEVL